MLRFLFILLTCASVSTNAAKAQFLEFADSEVVKLRSQGLDTLVRILFPSNSIKAVKRLNGIGEVSYFCVDYIFYKSMGAIYSVECIEYCNTDCSSVLGSSSKPLKVQDQRLFDYLSLQFEKMTGENIYPGIFKIASPDSTEIFYRDNRTSHETIYRIQVYTEKSYSSWTINPADITEFDGRAGRENLNYRYNTGTKLYGLYTLLLELCEGLDKEYKF